MNTFELSPSKDFARMVALMGLQVGNAPVYKPIKEKVPETRFLLTASHDLPSVAEAPDELKWVIQQMREVAPQEQLGLLDILGLYESDSSRIKRYDLLIQLVALKHEWPVEVLQRIVHWHELAHAANHLGLDEAGAIWKGFEYESADVTEYFAQIYTFKMLVETGDDEALQVMEEFTPRQPRCYQTYLQDKEKTLEQINLALLEARRRAPVALPHFEAAFSAAWGIEFMGYNPMADAHIFVSPLMANQGFSKLPPPNQFTVSGRKIKITFEKYTPNTSTLDPEVAHSPFEAVNKHLNSNGTLSGLHVSGTDLEELALKERGAVVELWSGRKRCVLLVRSESSTTLWKQICDMLGIQLPTFARLLREENAHRRL